MEFSVLDHLLEPSCADIRYYLLERFMPSCARGVLRAVCRSWRGAIVSAGLRCTVTDRVKFACWTLGYGPTPPGSVSWLGMGLGVDGDGLLEHISDHYTAERVDQTLTLHVYFSIGCDWVTRWYYPALRKIIDSRIVPQAGAHSVITRHVVHKQRAYLEAIIERSISAHVRLEFRRLHVGDYLLAKKVCQRIYAAKPRQYASFDDWWYTLGACERFTAAYLGEDESRGIVAEYAEQPERLLAMCQVQRACVLIQCLEYSGFDRLILRAVHQAWSKHDQLARIVQVILADPIGRGRMLKIIYKHKLSSCARDRIRGNLDYELEFSRPFYPFRCVSARTVRMYLAARRPIADGSRLCRTNKEAKILKALVHSAEIDPDSPVSAQLILYAQYGTAI